MKLILNPNQTLYFTSDSHYNHKNIVAGTSEWDTTNRVTELRDFDTLEEHNTTIVNNINEVVRKNDVLFHLGDWSFGGFERIEEFRNRILCKNVHLVIGNHDHHIQKNRNGIQSIFQSVHQYLQLNVRRASTTTIGTVDKYSFILFHYPIASWDSMGDGMMHLHGHCHLSNSNRIANGRAMDVGMDGNNLYPISMDDVLGILRNRPIKKLVLPQDHHEA